MVGGPSPWKEGEMPLGTVIETEPEWVCCCCEQDIPGGNGGFSVPPGSFCGPCFVDYLDYLFNRTDPKFLNLIRDKTHEFIEDKKERFECEIEEKPEPPKSARTLVIRERLEKEIEGVRGMIAKYRFDEASVVAGVLQGLQRALHLTDREPEEKALEDGR